MTGGGESEPFPEEDSGKDPKQATVWQDKGAQEGLSVHRGLISILPDQSAHPRSSWAGITHQGGFLVAGSDILCRVQQHPYGLSQEPLQTQNSY